MSRVRIRCVGAPPVVAHGFRVEHPATFHDLAVAIVDDDGTEDRIEILERENERLREHRCRVSGHDLAREWLKGFDE